MLGSFEKISEKIESCQSCLRLRSYCAEIGTKKKREFLNDHYWARPVSGFGDTEAWLWLIGLAPAAHGANRTGRVFTGDRSGEWLYRQLFEEGLANRPTSSSRMDGLVLRGAYVSCVVRCAPPENKPTREEIQNCHPYLREEFLFLTQKQVILALGRIAYENALALLREMEWKPKGSLKPKAFSHGLVAQFESLDARQTITLIASYHPSQQNTFTGILTREMFKDIFTKTKQAKRDSSSV